MGIKAVTSQTTSHAPESGLAAGELAIASPARFLEIGTGILETVLGRFRTGRAYGFNTDELRAEAWVRLHELSRKEAGRPRTRYILRLEIKKAITRFIKREREHMRRCAGLFLEETENPIEDADAANPSAPEIAHFTLHHCAPYSFQERLRDLDKTFSGLKAWNFSHLNSECEARKMAGIELIRAELQGLIDSLQIVPFRVSATAADKRACCRAA